MYLRSFRARSATEVKIPRLITSRCILANHDVDFLRPPRPAEQLMQKGDELGAGVPLGRFALYFAGLHIQSRI